MCLEVLLIVQVNMPICMFHKEIILVLFLQNYADATEEICKEILWDELTIGILWGFLGKVILEIFNSEEND